MVLQAVQGIGSEVMSEDLISQSPLSPCAQEGEEKGGMTQTPKALKLSDEENTPEISTDL